MIQWPWRKHVIPEHELEEARKALREARAAEARTRRLIRDTKDEISRNHIAPDMWAAMKGPRRPREGHS